jgi:hypothetical protein
VPVEDTVQFRLWLAERLGRLDGSLHQSIEGIRANCASQVARCQGTHADLYSRVRGTENGVKTERDARERARALLTWSLRYALPPLAAAILALAGSRSVQAPAQVPDKAVKEIVQKVGDAAKAAVKEMQ